MLRACLLTLLAAATFSGFVPARAAAAPAAPSAGTLKRLADRRIADAAVAAPAALPAGTFKGALRVTLDPQVPSTAAMDAISTILHGKVLIREAAAKVCEQLKLSMPDSDKDDFEISDVSISMTGTGLLSVNVIFDVPQHTPSLAGPFLTAVAEQVQQRLRGPYEDQLRRVVAVADENLHRARTELTELRGRQREFYEKAGRTDLSRESVLAEAKAMETEEQKLRMDQVGHTARQKALEERIAKIAAKAETRAAGDPVAAELKKVVDLREQELGTAKELDKVAKIPASDVRAIEIKLAEARAEWLNRREAAGSLAGRDILAKLNEELSAIEVDNAETEARLMHIDDQLAKNRAILPIADEYQDSLALPLKLVEREVESARMQRSKAEQKYRAFVPATVVAMPPK